MKTIEGFIEELKKSPMYKLGDDDLVKGSIEFAQRWIPVEEELPPIGIEVIVKERFNEHEIYLFNSTRDRLVKCQDNCITHWRKIELK